MRKIIALISITILLFACGRKNTPGKNEVIFEGRFIHSRAHVIYFDIIHVDHTEKWDSVVLNANGMFYLKKKIQEPYFLKVYLNESSFFTIVAKPGDHLYLSGSIPDFKNAYNVSGSPESELIHQYLTHTKQQYAKLDSIAIFWENHKYDLRKMRIRDSLDSISKIIYSSQEKYTADLVRKNMQNLGTLFIVYQYFGPYPVLDTKTYLPLLDSLAKTLLSLYPTNEHVHHLLMKIKKAKLAEEEQQQLAKRLSPGNPAPLFSLPDKNDSLISLDKFKGRYVLLHFWATWSPTSSKELRILKMYHATYAQRGVVFISIAFDYDKNMWEKVINSEKLNWIQLCDFKYIDSPIAKLYGIKKIPQYFLIDPQGIIVSKSNKLDEIGPELYKIFFKYMKPSTLGDSIHL